MRVAKSANTSRSNGTSPIQRPSKIRYTVALYFGLIALLSIAGGIGVFAFVNDGKTISVFRELANRHENANVGLANLERLVNKADRMFAVYKDPSRYTWTELETTFQQLKDRIDNFHRSSSNQLVSAQELKVVQAAFEQFKIPYADAKSTPAIRKLAYSRLQDSLVIIRTALLQFAQRNKSSHSLSPHIKNTANILNELEFRCRRFSEQKIVRIIDIVSPLNQALYISETLEASAEVVKFIPELAELKQIRNAIGHFKAAAIIFDDEVQLNVGGGNFTVIHQQADESRHNALSRIARVRQRTQDRIVSLQIKQAVDGEQRRLVLLVFIFFAICIAGAIAVALKAFLNERINFLVQGTNRVAIGNLDYRMEIGVEDEFGQISAAINKMVESLETNVEQRKRAEHDLRELNNQLEQQINFRTRELRKAQEDLLAERTEELRVALDHMSGGIFMFDEAGKIRICSPTFGETYQLPPELTAIGTRAKDIMKFRAERGDYGPGDPEKFLEERLQRYGTQETIVVEDRVASGRVIELSLSPMPNGGVVGVFKDITERKESESRLIQSDKLATLGTLAAGTSHELSQPLNIIRIIVDSILFEVDKNASTVSIETEDLESIVAQVLRMAEIIDHMRILSRDEGVSEELFMPMHVIKNAFHLIENQFAAVGVSVNLTCPGRCGLVQGSPTQLEQVILNLLSNSCHAVQTRIEQTAQSNESFLGAIDIELIDDKDGNKIIISVCDNGCGIEEDALKKVFDPFFTTKEVGEGTGLGLSVSNSIIQAMSGTIAARNELVGACFEVSLPRVEPADQGSA